MKRGLPGDGRVEKAVEPYWREANFFKKEWQPLRFRETMLQVTGKDLGKI